MTRLTMTMALMLACTALPAQAEDGHKKCAAAYEQCIADCNSKYADDIAGRAACTPKCSGIYAACDAGVAYDKAKPWLEEQAKKTQKFMQDLMDRLKKGPPEDTEPSKDKSI